jgi:hypothetical protein
MAGGEPQKVGLQVLEGGEVVSLGTLEPCWLGHDLNLVLGGLVKKPFRGVGEGILEAQLSFQNQDFNEEQEDEKMALAWWAKVLSPALSLHSWPYRENILGCKLAASQEENYRSWSGLVRFQEFLEMDLVILVQ